LNHNKLRRLKFISLNILFQNAKKGWETEIVSCRVIMNRMTRYLFRYGILKLASTTISS